MSPDTRTPEPETQARTARQAAKRPDRQLLVQALLWCVFGGSLLLIFGPALLAHMQRAADPLLLNDDARQQIYPFYRYADALLFPRDYIGDYYLACLPWGYRALYTLAGYFDVAVTVSKVVPYVGLLITVTCVAMTAHAFGGKVGAWVAAALCLGSGVYLARMSGGLPRGFAFPLLAAASTALTYGRFRLLAALVPLGAAFYPAAAVPVGIALALALLALPASSRGQAASWSFQRRFGFVAATALSAILVLLPAALSSTGFGSIVRPSDVAAFPEIGPGGRYGRDDRAPFPGFFDAAPNVAAQSLIGHGAPWSQAARTWASVGERTSWLLVLSALSACVGFLCLAWTSHESRRFLLLGAAALIGHTIATPIAPYFYLPQRYIAYPMPILATIVIATGAAGYLTLLFSQQRARVWQPVVIALAAVPLLVCLGGRGSPHRGLTTTLHSSTALYSELARLPKDALIAGWPRGVLDGVPYAARRQVLINFETHQAFHTEYALEMRRRMEALIAAYFARSIGPLEALRDAHGVTHLLIERKHFEGRKPRYFKPFNVSIKRATARPRPGYEVLRQAEHGKQLKGGDYVLLDLKRLHMGPNP